MQFCSDLSWWYTFLESWNGLSLLQSAAVPEAPAHYIQTDASGTWGCEVDNGSNCSGIVSGSLTTS